MGGVTCELDRARRAGFPELRKLEDVGVWEQVCRALGTQVTIDVIAGTSAGGLNGGVLATAIARRAAMPNLRQQWKSLGDFNKLLIRGDTGDAGDQLSVLNGAFFAKSIADVFHELENAPTASTDDEDAVPSTVALTLTATALHGEPARFVDQAGVEFAQRDYHVLHEFRRAYEPDLDSPDLTRTTLADTFEGAVDRLARAARATASFPGAFEPVFGDSDWLMDGGVLDNEPFDPVLREIRKRPVERGTRRVLAYLVPSTGEDSESAAPDPDAQPGFVKPLVLATSLPRETNILEQLAAVRGMLARVAADRGPTNRLLAEAADDSARAEAPDGHVPVAAMAESLLPLYRERRYLGGLWQIRQVLAAAQTGTVALRPAPPWQPAGDLEAPWVPQTIDATGDTWGFGLSVAQDVVHNWLDAVRDVLLDRPSLGPTAAVISRSHRRLVAMAEAFEAGLRASMTDPQAGEKPLLALGATCFDAAAGPGGSRIGPAVRAAAKAIVDARGDLPEASASLALDEGVEGAIRRQLIVAVVEGTFATPTLDPAVPRFTFRRVGLRHAAGRPARVLYGLELNHFGAFLRASWRLSDWMWGRLDGCDHVAQLLLDPGRLRTLAANDGARLAQELGDIVGDRNAVQSAVEAIAAAGEGEGTSAHVETLRALVIRRAQLDVLREELPIISAEVASGDEKTQAAAGPWIDRFARAGDDPTKLWEAFEAYTLGTDSADEVLDSHVGKEGRRDAVLSAVRALRKDKTLPSIVNKLSSVAGGALHAYGASVDIADEVREHVDDAKKWLRAHWP
jgi:predicted acylesterase/phospholipase RssA